jgi:RimJ/RimL family protein N-acetyltransferase
MLKNSTTTLRRLSSPDWEEFSRLRKKGLLTQPEMYCPQRNEMEFSPEQWMQWLESPHSITLGLFCEESLVAISTMAKEKHQQETNRAWLKSLFVDPSARGMGFSRMMYEVRMGWALQRPEVHVVACEYRKSNSATHNVLKSYGFKVTGGRPRRWFDGETEGSVIVEIKKEDIKIGPQPKFD